MADVSVPEMWEVEVALDLLPSLAVETAYEAEVADQATRCRVEPYSSSLRQALIRRVSRSLAMRNLPLGVQIDELGATRIGSTDPEVRRLEGPYRRVPVG